MGGKLTLVPSRNPAMGAPQFGGLRTPKLCCHPFRIVVV